MHTILRITVAAALLALGAQGAWASCYVVYDSGKQIVYRAQTPPVDLSRDLHETLPQVAPGGTLVFSPDNWGCELEIHRLPGPKSAKAEEGAAPKSSRAKRRG